jgi:hypothetical protein
MPCYRNRPQYRAVQGTGSSYCALELQFGVCVCFHLWHRRHRLSRHCPALDDRSAQFECRMGQWLYVRDLAAADNQGKSGKGKYE